jgi:hypothetical protein
VPGGPGWLGGGETTLPSGTVSGGAGFRPEDRGAEPLLSQQEVKAIRSRAGKLRTNMGTALTSGIDFRPHRGRLVRGCKRRSELKTVPVTVEPSSSQQSRES